LVGSSGVVDTAAEPLELSGADSVALEVDSTGADDCAVIDDGVAEGTGDCVGEV
jgi:hypothetical protein